MVKTAIFWLGALLLWGCRPGQITFTHVTGLGEPGVESDVSALALDEDGNVFLAGRAFNVGAPGTDHLILRVGPNGTMDWSKRSSGGNRDVLNDLLVTPEGDVYAAGAAMTHDTDEVQSHALVLRYDSDGEFSSLIPFDSDCLDQATALAVAGDELLVAVEHCYPPHPVLAVGLYRQNREDDFGQLWGYSHYQLHRLNALAAAPDGAHWFAATYHAPERTDLDAWFFHVDSSWGVSLSTLGEEDATDAVVGPDGRGYALVRSSWDLDTWSDDGDPASSSWLFSYSPAREQEWVRRWNGPLELGEAVAMALGPAGEIIVAGELGQEGARFPRVTAYTPAGEVLWTHDLTYEEASELRVNDVAVGPDGEVILAGSMKTGRSQARTIFLSRLTADGEPTW